MKEAVADEFALRELLIGVALGAVVVGLLAAVVLVSLRRAWRSRPAPAPVPAAPAPVAAAPRPDPGPALAERRALVDGLADLALRLPAGLDREAVEVLARAGVVRRSADGLRFDPSWQDALGTEVSPDPAADGTVVRTVRDFFDDRGRPASRPQVVVATSGPTAGSAGYGAPGEPR